MNDASQQATNNQMQAIAELFDQHYEDILKLWLKQQRQSMALHSDLISEDELRQMSQSTLKAFSQAIAAGNMDDINHETFDAMKRNLKQVSERYAILGFSPSETAAFIFSLKEALLHILQTQYNGDRSTQFSATMMTNKLLDTLGLFSFECFVDTQKSLLAEQVGVMSAMSTPVMQIWQDILMIPIVGTVDSARAQEIMDAMLEGLTRTDSEIIILDIQGVASIDSAVANHLLKITKAVAMMGCKCIVSGVTSHVAQAMANLGLELGGVSSSPTLRKALRMALATLQEINAQKDIV